MAVLLQAAPSNAQSITQPPTGTTVPFEFDVSIGLYEQGPDNPQAVIPAAACIGIGVGIIGWIGIKLWSACLDLQMRNATNRAVVNIQAAAAPITAPVGTINPVASGCSCMAQSAGQPMPLLLEHSYDGQSWAIISSGMTTGEQSFVPDTGTWRITPMKIVATMDGMIVPPGTLETSTDLKEWTLVSVSPEARTVTPEPNHFYRIR